MKCWDQRENEIPPGFWIASSVELSNQFSIVRLEAGLGMDIVQAPTIAWWATLGRPAKRRDFGRLWPIVRLKAGFGMDRA
jgi:hypothetical protein